MLRDAREGAQVFNLIYWLAALPQIPVNLAGWALRELSQRPGWFWGTATIVGIVTLILNFAH